MTKAAGDEETLRELRRQLATDLAVIEEKRELRKEKIRNGTSD